MIMEVNICGKYSIHAVLPKNEIIFSADVAFHSETSYVFIRYSTDAIVRAEINRLPPRL